MIFLWLLVFLMGSSSVASFLFERACWLSSAHHMRMQAIQRRYMIDGLLQYAVASTRSYSDTHVYPVKKTIACPLLSESQVALLYADELSAQYDEGSHDIVTQHLHIYVELCEDDAGHVLGSGGCDLVCSYEGGLMRDISVSGWSISA